ncbi:hypothetical protein yaldo0001_31420 [Yersinia aldovae ATCC 35236]|nr:hypothetical protein yaldo0001_31420 [Yersinia aldovae ATCC 35236]
MDAIRPNALSQKVLFRLAGDSRDSDALYRSRGVILTGAFV